ncbi:hypothetical protein V1527DRAFT_517032 [Lipomyces starkeyi]
MFTNAERVQVSPTLAESSSPGDSALVTRETADAASVHSSVKEKGTEDSTRYLVVFEGDDDLYCPLNWSFKKKSFATMMYACCAFGPQFSVGFGPMLFAPISEEYGRKIGVIVPFFISGLFAIRVATANNLQTVLIMKFFQGLFDGAAVSNSGGVLGDIWRPEARGVALVLGATFSTSLPLRDLYVYYCDYRCDFIPESYHPWDLTVNEIVTKHLTHPFAMLMTPIVTAMCTYAAFAFGILHLGVVAMPVEFRVVRQWKEVPSCLPTLGMFVGIVLGGCMNIYAGRCYVRILIANHGQPVPEKRLIASFVGCFLLPIGLGCLNYLVDTSLRFSASAIAATTFTRLCFAAAFPLFGNIMFNNLGVPPGASLIGFVAIAMIPIPFVFYRFGAEFGNEIRIVHKSCRGI